MVFGNGSENLLKGIFGIVFVLEMGGYFYETPTPSMMHRLSVETILGTIGNVPFTLELLMDKRKEESIENQQKFVISYFLRIL